MKKYVLILLCFSSFFLFAQKDTASQGTYIKFNMLRTLLGNEIPVFIETTNKKGKPVEYRVGLIYKNPVFSNLYSAFFGRYDLDLYGVFVGKYFRFKEKNPNWYHSPGIMLKYAFARNLNWSPDAGFGGSDYATYYDTDINKFILSLQFLFGYQKYNEMTNELYMGVGVNFSLTYVDGYMTNPVEERYKDIVPLVLPSIHLGYKFGFKTK
ncbi:MAG: hypothetical protein Kow0079_14900 [Vicingaceae bacterium]